MKLPNSIGYKWSGSSRVILEAPVDAQIDLADSVIYLYGFTMHERKDASPSAVRGTASIRCKKDLRVNEIAMKLLGRTTKSDVIRDNKKVSAKDFVLLEHTMVLLKSTMEGILFKKDCNCMYPFEFFIDTNMPESISTIYGCIVYEIKLMMGYVDPSQFDFYVHRPIPLVELQSTEIKVLRTIGPMSSATSESIVVQGIWRDWFEYKFVTSSKITKIDSDLICNVSIMPLQSKSFKIEAIKIWLVQQLTLNSDKDQKCCRAQNCYKMNQSQKIVLQECKCQSDEFSADGSLSYEWSLPIREIHRKDQQVYKLYPYTFHPELALEAPHMKITHNLRFSILLDDYVSSTPLSLVYTSTQEAESGRCNFLASMFPSGLADRLTQRDSKEFPDSSHLQQKKIELSFTAPIYLLHQDSFHDVPPCYFDSTTIYTSGSSSSNDEYHHHLTHSAQSSTFSLPTPVLHHNRGTTVPFLITAQPHYNAEFYNTKSTISSSQLKTSNPWFDLVGKWEAEDPPEYT